LRPLRRRTRFEKLVKTARDVKLPANVQSAVPDIHPPKAVTAGATAVVAATAASAAISSLRRSLAHRSGDQ
jgi:hypothetical protein